MGAGLDSAERIASLIEIGNSTELSTLELDARVFWLHWSRLYQKVFELSADTNSEWEPDSENLLRLCLVTNTGRFYWEGRPGDDSPGLTHQFEGQSGTFDTDYVVPNPKVVYRESSEIDQLLGESGIAVLRQVTDLIQRVAAMEGWPLIDIEVQYERDLEENDWEYVIVVPGFDATFDEADDLLHQLYGHLDTLAKKLTDSERASREGMIYFDVKYS